MSNNMYTNTIDDRVYDDYLMTIGLGLFSIHEKSEEDKRKKEYFQRLREQAEDVEYEEVRD